MKRHLLPFLCLLVVLPVILIVMIAGYALVQQERTMQRMASSYAENLVETLASDSGGNLPGYPQSPMRGMGRGRMMHRVHGDIFSAGPGIPGWVAELNEDGGIKKGSPGAHIDPMITDAIREMTEKGVLGKSLKVRDKGTSYAVAIRAADSSFFVAAISWDHLFSSRTRSMMINPALILITAGLVLVAFFALWRWFVVPLRVLLGEMKRLELGRDTPSPQGGATPIIEIDDLRSAFIDLAEAAVEKEELKRNYVGDIVRTQENERSLIASDLHDGALQAVSAMAQRVQLALRGIRKSHAETQKVEEHLLAAQEAADFSIQEMRNICDQLSPPWIALGLIATLEEITDRLARNYSIHILLNTGLKKSIEMSPDRTLALCRIVQEAVANAVRHGGATEVTVNVDAEAQSVTLCISDNGCGFNANIDPQKLRVSGHRGISGMAERMSMFGGLFEIHSTPGEGTQVCVSLSYTLESSHLPGETAATFLPL